MVARTGRRLTISRDGTVIAGARSDSVTVNNEAVDITDKSAEGWRTYLPLGNMRNLSANVEGLITDDALLADALANGSVLLKSCVVAMGGVFNATGNFWLNNVDVSAPYDDAATFTATLESSGEMVTTFGPYVIAAPVVTVTGGADSGNLSVVAGTWGGAATVSVAPQWQYNEHTDLEADPRWINAANEAAAETRHALGDFVRYRETGSNNVGVTFAISNVVT